MFFYCIRNMPSCEKIFLYSIFTFVISEIFSFVKHIDLSI